MKPEELKAEELRDLAINALDDLKGIDVVSMDVRELTDITDYMIICTGRSTTHVKSLAENVRKAAKDQHLKFVRMEGETESEWILVDLGDVVIHVMLPATRAFYSLEQLWEPVKEIRDHNAS